MIIFLISEVFSTWKDVEYLLASQFSPIIAHKLNTGGTNETQNRKKCEAVNSNQICLFVCCNILLYFDFLLEIKTGKQRYRRINMIAWMLD